MNKLALMREQERAIDMLEEVLDKMYGKDRGPQIPNHPGNGQFKEKTNARIKRTSINNQSK